MFLENLYVGRDTPLQEGYVEGGWKYIRFFKARTESRYTEADLTHDGDKPVFEMLFDLKRDPGESNNLAASPGVAGIKAKLSEKCKSEVKRLNQERLDYSAKYLIR